uniref:Uncharacterized protein n=1 Tax=Anguilla anguilla TaxID=7936 RepID=A0A0E9SDZ2_ANGAN
MLNRLIKRFIY